MTEYNKLNHWYGWNGGECPVHPKTVIQGIEDNGTAWAAEASANDWTSFRGGFMIIEEHKEPREFWVDTEDGNVYMNYGSAASGRTTSYVSRYIVHVREVIDG